MDEQKLVQSLKEAFVPMFDRIENRLDGIDGRLDRIEIRLDNVETRLDSVEIKLDKVETRLDNVETKLDKVETKLDKVETRLDSVETKLDKVETRLDVIDERLENIETDVRVVKLDMETYVVPGIQILREGHQGRVENHNKLADRVDEFEQEFIKVSMQAFERDLEIEKQLKDIVMKVK